MTDVCFAPATAEHVLELAAHLRPGDLAEVLAAGYPSARAAIEASIADSTEAWALSFDGEVAVIFGVDVIEETVIGGVLLSYVWALTSTVVDRHRLTFMRCSRRFLRGMLLDSRRLVTLVDARYQAAIDWLAVLGFLPVGERRMPGGQLFHLAAVGGA